MSVNIYDTANQMEREIRQLPEFLALEEAFTNIKNDEETFTLFKDFQTIQIELQQKQMQGEEFTEEDTTKAQELSEKVQKSDAINELMVKEQSLSMIINDLNRIIMQPVQDVYSQID